ncbi:MAG: aminotransferase class III-fold pyridoxal phosphate-dependent enzyme [Armatimonadetes bacterium]|nr:aminotransferase class III-fold pyridoxal phosphate-dependent enzyme [Armatimonadota bacterium]
MLAELGKYVIAEPHPFVLDLERCQGMTLVTVDGQELFDWAGFYGSKLLGHNHPGLYEPEYLKRLSRAANNKVANPDFLTQECLDYYRLVYENAPEVMQNDSLEVYVVNSGAEAVENMMKYLVAKYNQKCLRAGRMPGSRRFLYFDRAFHGRTVFALGVTQTMDPVATKDFVGLASGGNMKLSFPHYNSERPHEENLESVKRSLEQVEAVLQHMADDIVGIIVEPIQGAGGNRVALPEFFQGLSRLTEEYGVYLGFDEVQTGLGATGKMWAIDHFDLPHPPMAVASGKKWGNGLVYMREPLDDIGVLDSTWGGTLADMVRVCREVEIVEQEGLVDRAAVLGDLLNHGLKEVIAQFDFAWNVRGMGLYQGFSLDTAERKAKLIKTARDEFGLLLLGAGNRSIRTRPNLSVVENEVDRFLSLLAQALDKVR